MNKKTFSFLVFVLGIVVLLVGRSFESTISPYLNIVGFVILMFGLYSVSTIWVKDKSDNENDKV